MNALMLTQKWMKNNDESMMKSLLLIITLSNIFKRCFSIKIYQVCVRWYSNIRWNYPWCIKKLRIYFHQYKSGNSQHLCHWKLCWLKTKTIWHCDTCTIFIHLKGRVFQFQDVCFSSSFIKSTQYMMRTGNKINGNKIFGLNHEEYKNLYKTEKLFQ